MTSKDLSIFNSLRPFSIGFDDMFDQFESMLGNGGMVQNNYPPYNIRKAGKDKYAIEVAVAGFNKDDVEVEFEDKLLTVRTKKINKTVEKDGDEINQDVSSGDNFVIDMGTLHRMKGGDDGITFIEVQRGVCDESDIVRISDDYNRC